jgi:hypothetical protein
VTTLAISKVGVTEGISVKVADERGVTMFFGVAVGNGIRAGVSVDAGSAVMVIEGESVDLTTSDGNAEAVSIAPFGETIAVVTNVGGDMNVGATVPPVRHAVSKITAPTNWMIRFITFPSL